MHWCWITTCASWSQIHVANSEHKYFISLAGIGSLIHFNRIRKHCHCLRWLNKTITRLMCSSLVRFYLNSVCDNLLRINWFLWCHNSFTSHCKVDVIIVIYHQHTIFWESILLIGYLLRTLSRRNRKFGQKFDILNILYSTRRYW